MFQTGGECLKLSSDSRDSCTPSFANLFTRDASPDSRSATDYSAFTNIHVTEASPSTPEEDFTTILKQSKSLESNLSITSYDSGAGYARCEGVVDVPPSGDSQEVLHCCDAGIHEQSHQAVISSHVPDILPVGDLSSTKSEQSSGTKYSSVVLGKCSTLMPNESPVVRSDQFIEPLISDPTAPVQKRTSITIPPQRTALSTVFSDLEASSDVSLDGIHLPEGVVKQWAAQLVLVVEQLHELGIIIK